MKNAQKNQNLATELDNSMLAMFVLEFSSDGLLSFSYLSKNIEKVFTQFSAQDFQQNPSFYFTLILKENYGEFIDTLRQSQGPLSSCHCVFKIEESDETMQWVDFFAEPDITQTPSTTWHGYFKRISNPSSANNLRKEQPQFSSIINNITDGFALFNNVGELLEMNPAGKEILGFDKNKTLKEIQHTINVHPDDREQLVAYFLCASTQKTQARRLECRIYIQNDVEKWIETTIIKIEENSLLVNFRDITEQVAASKQKEFQAENLKSLIDNTPEIVWSVDTSCRIISFNKAFESLVYKYTGQRIFTGKNILDTLDFSGEHLEMFKAFYQRALAGESFTEHYNITLQENLWREVSFYPIIVADKIIGTACYGKDVTDRKLNEFALQKTNEQLQAAQNIAKLGYWEIDLIGDNHYWSEEMYQIFEFEKERRPLCLSEAIDYIHQDDKEGLLEQHRLMMEQDKYLNLDFRLILPSGNIKYMVMNAKLVRDEQGRAIQIRITSQDITEKKKVENEIVRKENRFKALIEKSKEGIAIINEDRKIVEISPGGKKIFNIEQIEEYHLGYIHPDDLPGLRAVYNQVYEDANYSPTANFRYIKANGELLWLETNFNNQFAESSINGIVMNFRDITERKKAEQLLKSERYLLRTIIDNLPMNIYVKDLESRKTLVNKAELDFLGFKDEKDGLGKNDFEVFTEEYAKVFLEEDQKVFKTGKAIINKETLIEDLHKKRVWYLLSKIPMTNEQGEIDRLIGISIDITEQKLVQEQLRASEMMFRDLAKSVPGVVFQLCIEPDNTMHFPFLSSKIKEIFDIDFTTDKLDFAKYIYPEDRSSFFNAIQEAVTYKNNWNYEGRILGADNEVKWFQGIASPSMVSDRIIYNGLLIDISERKNNEEAKKQLRILELSLEKEKEINALKSRFISFASHEFRTPLATIVTSIDILGIYTKMLDNVELRDKISYHLNKVTNQSHRLTEMLADVLLMEKSANDKINLQLENIDIVALIIDLNNQYYNDRADNRKLDLCLPTINKTIYSDASLLKHIINNLIDNAFKYSKDSQNPKLMLEINEKHFKIVVQDYGIGIPLEDQQHLFETFFRANNVLNIEGTGLGLNITKEFTYRLGGTISFKSELHKGTEFTLMFPNKYQ